MLTAEVRASTTHYYIMDVSSYFNLFLTVFTYARYGGDWLSMEELGKGIGRQLHRYQPELLRKPKLNALP